MRIEKDVKIEDGRGRKPIYPFSELEVNESFFVDGKTSSEISGSIVNARKKHPDRKFKSKTYDDGVRVWRIK